MCPNDPGKERKASGVCHVCAMRDRLPGILRLFVGSRGTEEQEVTFCGGCCHWFCEECKKNVMGRLTGFVDQHVRGPHDGCCGPREERERCTYRYLEGERCLNRGVWMCSEGIVKARPFMANYRWCDEHKNDDHVKERT